MSRLRANEVERRRGEMKKKRLKREMKEDDKRRGNNRKYTRSRYFFSFRLMPTASPTIQFYSPSTYTGMSCAIYLIVFVVLSRCCVSHMRVLLSISLLFRLQ